VSVADTLRALDACAKSLAYVAPHGDDAAYAAYAYAYAADAWRSARAQAEADQLALSKWMLGPALLDGLRAYAATIGGAS
jgi:hypothetical protein